MRLLLLPLLLVASAALAPVGADDQSVPGTLVSVTSGSGNFLSSCDRQVGCGECVDGQSEAWPKTLSELFGCEDSWLRVGGSYRIRFHDEDNMRRAGLTGQDDTFQLHLTRIWLDADVHERVSIRAGFMDAASFGQTFRARNNEVNRADLYQLYADVKLLDSDESLTARLGRQEMRYGSARLIMAPNWANRRRTHDGVRMMWKNSDWNVDAFWVRPAFRNAAHFTAFDATNHNQQLYGVFSTLHSLEDAELELYWLAYDIDAGSGNAAAGAKYDTLGSRYHGGTDSLLFEFEGGYQFGRNPDDSAHSAGFFVGGVGRRFSDMTWKPELWFLWDWASGSGRTGNGFHTYVQRAHYYLGNMDLFGRRNLQDFNTRLTLSPTERLKFTIWYHYFLLATRRDVAYNLNMRPFAGLTAGSAGSRDLGHELDLTLTWQVNEQTQVRFGYDYFWSGRYYDKTPGVPTNGNAQFIYGHFQYEF